VACVVGILLAWWRRDVRILVRIGVPTVTALLVLSAWALYVSGTPSPLGGYGKSTGDLAFGKGTYVTSLPGFLVSPERGMLVWTPVLFLVAAAMWAGWRAAPDWTKALFAGGVAYTLLQIYVNPYGGDYFWGYRHGLELLVTLTPLAVATARSWSMMARQLLPWVVGVQFAVIAFGSVFDASPRVIYGDEWRGNSLLVLIGESPVVVPALLLLLALAGTFATRGVLAGAPSPDSVAPVGRGRPDDHPGEETSEEIR
jgi:hypothetical protein